MKSLLINMNRIKNIICMFILYTMNTIVPMLHQNLHLVVIPGQNGLGGQNIQSILPYIDPRHVYHVKTPLIFPDFGQTRCISYLEETLQPLLQFKHAQIIIHASSQGTATLFNYLSKIISKVCFQQKESGRHTITSHTNNQKDVDNYNNLGKIRAIILESVMLSGNSVIMHTINNMYVPGISRVPGAYYGLPFLAQLIYPLYAPAGQHVCFSSGYLKIPTIIIHDKNDPQISFQDSQTFYALLKSSKVQDVYFIPTEHDYMAHVNLLNKDDHKAKVLQAILKKHLFSVKGKKDLPKSLEQTDLTPYQPEVKQEWENSYREIQKKELTIQKIDIARKGIFIALLGYVACRFFYAPLYALTQK